MLLLLRFRCPDQAAPALGEDVFRIPAHHAGVRDELDQRISVLRVVIRRNMQIVLQRLTVFLIGHQLKLRRHIGNHALQFTVGSLVHTAAVSSAHSAALSVSRTALSKGGDTGAQQRQQETYRNQFFHVYSTSLLQLMGPV